MVATVNNRDETCRTNLYEKKRFKFILVGTTDTVDLKHLFSIDFYHRDKKSRANTFVSQHFHTYFKMYLYKTIYYLYNGGHFNNIETFID